MINKKLIKTYVKELYNIRSLLNFISSQNQFLKDTFVLISGTFIAQLIPVVITPILTRLYIPEDFGIYALFMAIIFILGSISCGRYELAIMLPKKNDYALNIFALGFIINLAFSIFLLVLITFLHDYLAKIINNPHFSALSYFIPINVFLIGLSNLLNYLNNRFGYYKNLSKAKVYKAIAMSFTQVVLGMFKLGAAALIIAQTFSQFVYSVKLFYLFRKNEKCILKKINKALIISLAKRYSYFPKFSMWGILINNLAKNLTTILISYFYGNKILGFYNLAQRVLELPLNFIATSFSQVFFYQATKEKHRTGKATKIFTYALSTLTVISLPIFIILFFFIKKLFVFFFGEQWKVAGIYAKILIPLVFVKFIVISVMVIDTIFEKQKFYLFSQVILFLGNILLLVLLKSQPFEKYLIFSVLFNIFFYLSYLLALINFARGNQ